MRDDNHLKKNIPVISAEYIAETVREFNEICKTRYLANPKETNLQQISVFIEILDGKLQTYWYLFKEKVDMGICPIALLDYTVLKLVESFQYLSDKHIRMKTLKILKCIITLGAINKNDLQSLFILIYKVLTICMRCYQKHITNVVLHSFEDFYISRNDSFHNSIEILIYLVYLITSLDRSVFINYSVVCWRIIELGLRENIGVKKSLKLLALCMYNNQFPSSEWTKRTLGYFCRSLKSFPYKIVADFLKIFDPSTINETLVSCLAEYLVDLDQHFNKFHQVEQIIIRLISNSNSLHSYPPFSSKISSCIMKSNSILFPCKFFNSHHGSDNDIWNSIIQLLNMKSYRKEFLQEIADKIFHIRDISIKISALKLIYYCVQEFELKLPDFFNSVLSPVVQSVISEISSDPFDKISILYIWNLFRFDEAIAIRIIVDSLDIIEQFDDDINFKQVVRSISLGSQMKVIDYVIDRFISTKNTRLLYFISKYITEENYSPFLKLAACFNEISFLEIVAYLPRLILVTDYIDKLTHFHLFQCSDETFSRFCNTLFSQTPCSHKESIWQFVTRISSASELPSNPKDQYRLILFICNCIQLFRDSADLLVESIAQLIELSFICKFPYIPLISKHISRVLTISKTSIIEIYLENSETINKRIMGRVLLGGRENLMQYIPVIECLFGKKDASILNHEILNEMIVYSLSECSKSLLNKIANSLHVSGQALLAKHAKYVFPSLFRNLTFERLRKTVEFIENVSSLEISQIIKAESCHIIRKSFIDLYNNDHKILSCILMMFHPKAFSQEIQYYSGSLSHFFEVYLLEIVANFKIILASQNIAIKKSVIRSLKYVILHAGPKAVDSNRLKIISLLKCANEFTIKVNLVDFLLDTWLAFISVIPDNHLIPLSSHIVQSVLNLLYHNQDKAFDILHKIIVEQRGSAHTFFHDIHCFHFSERFKPIVEVLVDYWKKYLLNTNIRTILTNYSRQISSEQSELRRYAIINFSEFILHRYISNSYDIFRCNKDIIREIYVQLIRCCSDPESDCLLEAGRCIGLLGYIDFENEFILVEKHTSKVIFMEKHLPSKIDLFGVALLSKLAHYYMTANETWDKDYASFSIQEVMRVYNFAAYQKSYLIEFPSNIKEVLVQHTLSSYKIEDQFDKFDVLRPVFSTQECITYSEWITRWCTGLLSTLPLGHFQSALLRPCLYIARRSVSLAKFILPYAAVSSINLTSVNCISCEINHIISSINNSSGVSEHLINATHTIMDLIDFIKEYLKVEKQPSPVLREVLDLLCEKQLSLACFSCKLFTLSLRYIESYIIKHSNKEFSEISDCYSLMKKIYFNLQDYDSFVAINRITPLSINDSTMALQLEIEGRYMEAISCYEKQLSDSSTVQENKIGIMKCYLNLGQFKIASSFSDVSCPSISPSEIHLKLEALWRLSSWAELDEFSKANSKQFFIKTLLSLQQNSSNVEENLILAYKHEADYLSNLRGHIPTLQSISTSLSRMHMLFDIEMYCRTLGFSFDIYKLPTALYPLNTYVFQQAVSENAFSYEQFQVLSNFRLQSVKYEFYNREPIINLHRILFEHKHSKDISGSFWINVASLARKSGYPQTAFNYLLFASKEVVINPCYMLEMAKYLVKNRSQSEALAFLKKHADNDCKAMHSLPLVSSKLRSLICRLMSETSDCDPAQIIMLYNDLLKMEVNQEKVHFALGNYFYKLMKVKNNSRDSISVENLEISTIHHYGSSLKYGYRYLYHSLPRFITLWLDSPETMQPSSNTRAVSSENNSMQKINIKVKMFFDMLPPFVFLCAMSQLISRIGHPNSSVWNVLSYIFTKLLHIYPHQIGWQMIWLLYSNISVRVRRCKQIFDSASNDINIMSILTNLQLLVSNLLEISNRSLVSDKHHFVLSESFPGLRAMIDSHKLSNIIVPILDTLTCRLPSSVGAKDHSLFASPSLFMSAINEKITVLPSLIRPKRIEVIASDGLKYSLLCKPKDDLRRDSRLMEFSSLVNKLLFKNPKARRRDLRIIIYSVLLLNEECGIIEWVDNTISYRSILLKRYSDRGGTIPMNEIKNLCSATKKDPDELLKLYTTKILPSFPPVFQEYFIDEYTDATSWYNARVKFMRSAAVMSMVGYIVGLGDRHGDNILISNSGELVHVDFNCLFNKGDTFEWPEKVPFRLTHNMIAAMGPLGVESCFRSCCEITLETIRSKADALICILSSFLHDPLVEWTKNSKRHQQNLNSEPANQMALKMLQQVERRILGIMPESNFLVPLSVQGQVHQLIQEAVSVKNLSRMYFGWAAFY